MVWFASCNTVVGFTRTLLMVGGGSNTVKQSVCFDAGWFALFQI